MKSIIIILAVLFSVNTISMAQDKEEKYQFIKSKKCGSFLTLLADNTPLKEECTLEESTQQTNDGGTSVFLKVNSKKSKETNSILTEEAPSLADTFTITSAEVFVFPNPVNNQFTVKTNISSKEKVTFVLYDFNGNEVKRVENIKPMGEISIPRAELKQGDFIYKIFNSSKVLASGRLKVD